MYGDIMNYWLKQVSDVIHAEKCRCKPSADNFYVVCEPFTVATKDMYNYGCSFTCPLLFTLDDSNGLRRICMATRMGKVLR
jgi:hypothetical protein